MQLFETQEQLERECYRMTMVGEDCHMEPRDGSIVLVARDRIIGRVAGD